MSLLEIEYQKEAEEDDEDDEEDNDTDSTVPKVRGKVGDVGTVIDARVGTGVQWHVGFDLVSGDGGYGTYDRAGDSTDSWDDGGPHFGREC